MREVSTHARGVGNIVDGQLGDQRVHLHEERERLPDATGSAQDGHLRPRDAAFQGWRRRVWRRGRTEGNLSKEIKSKNCTL